MTQAGKAVIDQQEGTEGGASGMTWVFRSRCRPSRIFAPVAHGQDPLKQRVVQHKVDQVVSLGRLAVNDIEGRKRKNPHAAEDPKPIEHSLVIRTPLF